MVVGKMDLLHVGGYRILASIHTTGAQPQIHRLLDRIDRIDEALLADFVSRVIHSFSFPANCD